MNGIETAIRQPVSVAVGVILILLAGVVALGRIPIQLTPNVEDTIIAITTFWEGASPEEVEREIVDPQEDKLEGLENLVAMTSECQQGFGRIRLQFKVGMPKAEALRQVSDKLREVPSYPETTDEPVIEASDPENQDYIAWVVLETTDPNIDIRTLQDFAEDRIQPALERVSGMAEVNVLGGRERELQIRFDPVRLARRSITLSELASTIRRSNRNVSAGELPDGKSDVRVRTVGRFESVADAEAMIVRDGPGGVVRLGDVAEVVQTFKEPRSFVRSRGRSVIAINAQKEVGANVMEVMEGLRREVARLNEPGGVLATEAHRLGLDGTLHLEQVYDQTMYIEDALDLVQGNIWIGGSLAIIVLLLFLRSLRSAGIIALAIPISVVGAIVAMVAMGRSVNVISLAGMAFAVGMVVDNAIVVLENIHRHIEMGKRPYDAARDGTREVWGAVLAATLTTIVVFIPILLIQEEAGQLFRDIALAICAAVGLSLVVAVTVIPTTAARWLRAKRNDGAASQPSAAGAPASGTAASERGVAAFLGRLIERMCGSWLARVSVVLGLTALSATGTWLLMPPQDYLPQGNRNLAFGLMIPPSGYNLEQKSALGERVEETVRPFWEAGALEPGSPEYERAAAALPQVPTFDWMRGAPGDPVTPPPLENYFLVSFENILFHGGISRDPKRVVDMVALMQHASRMQVVPGTLGFAFQIPLFQLGGATGSAVKLNLAGDDLSEVSSAAEFLYGKLVQEYGPQSVQPSPSNFNIPGPELQVRPRARELRRLGLTAEELGLAVQTSGDGMFVGEYDLGGDRIDMKLISTAAGDAGAIGAIGDLPIATPAGHVVPLASVATLERVGAPAQINRVGRQRAVTLQFTAPPGMPLETAMKLLSEGVEAGRAAGAIPPSVTSGLSGSASKLRDVQKAMLGDGSIGGTLSSSLVLALLVVYLLMCVLFQSFTDPLVILFSVPLATLGGFAALFGVFIWSVTDRYMPIQSLDVLTMLGFVILIGVVVNNAILIVHQSLNFMGRNPGVGAEPGEGGEPLSARVAIGRAVRTRVRPIFMGMLTSVGGMLPLVLMPGSGSELYRGLGSVVIGGLLVSTIFTLLLVPLLFSMVLDAKAALARRFGTPPVPAPRVAALLVAGLALAVASGCSGAAPARDDRALRGIVESVLAVELGAAGIGDGGMPATPAAPPPPLPPERLAELEELAGDRAYASDAAPGLDLEGEELETRPITRERAVRIALENHLGLRIERYQPRMGDEDLRAAEAAFDLTLFSTFDFEKRDQPTTVPVLNGIVLGSPISANQREALVVGGRRKLATGATVALEGRWQRSTDDTPDFGLDPDPAFGAQLSFRVTQPLLRGRGREVATSEVALRRNGRDRARQQLRAVAIALAAEVEEAYWQLASAREAVRVQERLLAQGEDVRRVLAERESFDARPAELADAVATVEERRASLVRVRRALQAASDRLKFLLEDPATRPAGEVLLLPADELAPPAETATVPGLRQALITALRERPEVEQALLLIDDAALRARVAKNLRLPSLDLSAEVVRAGLDGGAGDAVRDWSREDFTDYVIGLTFELPLGNRAADAAHRRAELEREAARVALRQAAQQVIREVKEALRDVRTQRELVAATRVTRIAQAENLRAILAEEATRAAPTPEFLSLKFLRQERLAGARAQEMEARAALRTALVRLRRAVGGMPPGISPELEVELEAP